MAGEEERLERYRREHNELLQELRAVIPGSEVLFGFLLAIRFTGFYSELTRDQVHVYYGTLLATGLSLALFFAPAAYHRVQFRADDKGVMLRKGNVEALVGMLLMALSFTGVLFLVTDLTFGRVPAWAVAMGFLAFTLQRWWAWAIVRRLRGKPER